MICRELITYGKFYQDYMNALNSQFSKVKHKDDCMLFNPCGDWE